MELLIERCAGLDVHKASVTATVRVPDQAGGRLQQTRSFRATTAGLVLLGDWLASLGVTVVGMESTGVSWRPVYYLLEDDFQCWLLNAAHLRNVPGRKTDVADSVWICQLVEHGLVRPSFVPPKPIRELRDLTRYRKALIQERTREAQRLQKVLEDAGIKLGTVASDVLGVSGRAMLDALVSGTHDPAVLAELAKGRLRAKLPALREALEGRFRAHHALLLGELLAHLDYLDEAVERLSTQVARVVAPLSPLLALLITIPGSASGPLRSSSPRSAPTWASSLSRALGELGGDLPRQQRVGRQAPRGHDPQGLPMAADRAHRGRQRRGPRQGHLSRQPVRQAEGTAGHKKAIVAVAHSILVIAWHLLATGQPYSDLGADWFLQRHSSEAYRNRLVRQLERMGHKVTLEPADAA